MSHWSSSPAYQSQHDCHNGLVLWEGGLRSDPDVKLQPDLFLQSSGTLIMVNLLLLSLPWFSLLSRAFAGETSDAGNVKGYSDSDMFFSVR